MQSAFASISTKPPVIKIGQVTLAEGCFSPGTNGWIIEPKGRVELQTRLRKLLESSEKEKAFPVVTSVIGQLLTERALDPSNFSKGIIFIPLQKDILDKLPQEALQLLIETMNSPFRFQAERAAYIIERTLNNDQLFADTFIFLRCHSLLGSRANFSTSFKKYHEKKVWELETPAERSDYIRLLARNLTNAGNYLKETKGTLGIMYMVRSLNQRLNNIDLGKTQSRSDVVVKALPAAIMASASIPAAPAFRLNEKARNLINKPAKVFSRDTPPAINPQIPVPQKKFEKEPESDAARYLRLLSSISELDKIEAAKRESEGPALAAAMTQRPLNAELQEHFLPFLCRIAEWTEPQQHEKIATLFFKNAISSHCVLGFFYLLQIQDLSELESTCTKLRNTLGRDVRNKLKLPDLEIAKGFIQDTGRASADKIEILEQVFHWLWPQPPELSC